MYVYITIPDTEMQYIGEFVVEGFFFLKVVTFFATLTANYGPLLHLITGFNWLPTEIMAWGP